MMLLKAYTFSYEGAADIRRGVKEGKTDGYIVIWNTERQERILVEKEARGTEEPQT
jgi:hypothetical protein